MLGSIGSISSDLISIVHRILITLNFDFTEVEHHVACMGNVLELFHIVIMIDMIKNGFKCSI